MGLWTKNSGRVTPVLMNNGFNIHSHVFHLIIAIIDDEPGINSDVTVHNAHTFLDVYLVLLSLENLYWQSMVTILIYWINILCVCLRGLCHKQCNLIPEYIYIRIRTLLKRNKLNCSNQLKIRLLFYHISYTTAACSYRTVAIHNILCSWRAA